MDSRPDVKILGKETIYRGHVNLVKLNLQYKFFSGEWSGDIQRELVEQRKAVGVFLFDPALQKVVLIEQFRVGALNDEESPWLLEIIAGIIDTQETEEEVAKREVYEESALKVLDIIPILKYWVSPGAASEEVALFCARVDSTKAGNICGLAEENEDIRVHVLSIDEFWQVLDNHRIRNGSALIASLWFRINYEKICAEWA